VKTLRGSGRPGDHRQRGIVAAESLTVGGLGSNSGRCTGRGRGWNPRGASWRQGEAAAGLGRGWVAAERWVRGGAGGRQAAEQGSCGTGASVAAAGIRVRVQRGLGLLFVGRRGTLSVRAQGGARRRFREGRCAPGRKGKGEEEAAARAMAGRGRKGEERGAARLRRKWAGRGPCGKKDRWASGSTWAREKRERRGKGRAGLGVAGPRGEKRGEGRGPAQEILGCFHFSSLLFFFFPTLKLFKHNYLNSNKFEFKPYKFNTRKTML
jgi:hypothetical protein